MAAVLWDPQLPAFTLDLSRGSGWLTSCLPTHCLSMPRKGLGWGVLTPRRSPGTSGPMYDSFIFTTSAPFNGSHLMVV